jgi:hypothetical protein
MLVPSLVQITGKPLSCCQRTSALLSPLKSAAVEDMQGEPNIGKRSATGQPPGTQNAPQIGLPSCWLDQEKVVRAWREGGEFKRGRCKVPVASG